MTIRTMVAALAMTAFASATLAQEGEITAIDCTLPANAEVQLCIDQIASGATGIVQVIGPLGGLFVLTLFGAGGGGGSTPVTPTTSGTN